MRLLRITLLTFCALLALSLSMGADDVLAAKLNLMKGCKACHSAGDDQVRGRMINHSAKFKSIQVDVGPLVWIIKYDEKTKVNGAASKVEDIAKDGEVLVTFSGTDMNPMATIITAKPPYELPKEKIMGREELQDLVRKGPSQAKFTLVDARPPDAFNEGHLPWAKNMPYTAFEQKYMSVLPEDKGELVVFYCGGFT